MRRRTPIGHCQPITSSGRRTLRRCKNNEEGDNVVLIDVDSDDNVIIIDVPEPVQQKLRGSSGVRKDKDGPFQTVICIDDDETADNNIGEVSSDGSSNTKSCPALNHSRNSVDGKFGKENTSPVKLSKCKRTYSGKGYTTNRYGLSTESVSASSDDDTPDCMVMEDSCGDVREQWEKASSKRKSEVGKGQSCMGDQASASKFHSDAHHNLETEDAGCSSSGNASSEEEIETGYSNLRSTSQSPEKTPTDFGLKSTEKTQFSHSKVDVRDRGESQKHVEHSGSSFCNEEELSSPGPPLFSTEEQGSKQANRTKYFSWEKEKPPPVEPCLSNSEPTVDINLCSNNASLPNEDDFLCKSKNSVETRVDHSRVVSRNKGEKFQQFNPSVVPDEEVEAVPKETLCQSRSSGGMGISYEEAYCEEKGKAVPKEQCLGEIRYSEAEIVEGKSLVIERDNAFNLRDGDVTLSDQECLINEREKLKETDEYKRAVEEEWASRQRELQIQAEEAQQLRRLRKRKKAESMRLLDMERRQKQRLEEMRETQKKDEENMNLKEQLRAEVREELNILEMTCHDMVSLLRGLGIDVSLQNEVRAAYKRALLSFHPDRASGSDIRQLVEAEEKFKLISRMKEKFLSTS